ncbi:MAG: sigma-70 family RNA polymerase sigma factor [Magnetococcales bacterium]|nr:sigma-70 family RNA polymerase sigma factor [Magnetococcales bacterium]MBF0583992.1 sigma-70 family RNA polymerase sigma factor [Magnetococcales bacterium]
MSESQTSSTTQGGGAQTGKSHDQLLVDRTLAGDQKSFELLVRQYQGKIATMIGRAVQDPDKVRDLVQETWLKAYRALPAFRGDAAFYTWLYRIAVNTVKNHWLTEGRTVALTELSTEGEETEFVLPQLRDHETPEKQLLRKEMQENLKKAMDALVPAMKRAILLRDVQGLSYEEIATILDCPIGTVRSRIFRGRQEIAQQMRVYLTNRSSVHKREEIMR